MRFILHHRPLSIVAFTAALLTACNVSGPSGLFGKQSPHEQYGEKISNAGLKETALGAAWFTAAERSLSHPLRVTIPYSESGYFAAEEARATAIKFAAKRGQKLTISINKTPQTGFAIFLDLYRPNNDSSNKYLQSADTTNADWTYEVKEDGDLLLRLQPELLKSGDYTLSISMGPSLAFPVAGRSGTNIGSFWGAGRDNGQRQHEGVDIFAPRRTPLVAAAPGVITRVGENNLGGKVVMLRPQGKDYTLYYAHLDEQLTTEGTTVNTGDTLGLVGNTGNARTTAPHLHFGIYTNSGAIDPLPFVDPTIKKPANITAPQKLVNGYVATEKKLELTGTPNINGPLAANTPLYVQAATGNQFKVLLPNGDEGFVPASEVAPLSTVRSIKLTAAKPILAAPYPTSPVINTLTAGQTVNVQGVYGDYFYVKKEGLPAGWIVK